MKKEVRRALEEAKKLERTPLPTKEEIVAIYKDGMKQAEKLRKLLKPQWFVKDDKCGQRKKTTKSSTRKKKSL